MEHEIDISLSLRAFSCEQRAASCAAISFLRGIHE